MKSKLTRAISFMLSAVTLTTMFSGCEKKPKEGIAGQATSVSYNTDGTFTTTVTAEEASFSEDLTASDITVSYLRLDEEAYAKAVEKEGEDNIDKINRGDYMVEVKSAVTGVTRKDNKTLEVSFTDEKAAENLPSSYFVRVAEKKTGAEKEVGAGAEVNYPQHSVTPNIQSLSVFDKDIRLTLELKEGEFKQDVSKDTITLGGCLEKLNIENISASGKNLTLQLTGDITKHESSNAYVDGVVNVKKDAIKDGWQPIKVQIPVDTILYSFDAEKLAVDNGKVTVPFVLGGYRLTDNANADSFKIDGAKVTEFKKTGESSGIITLTDVNATDKNSAAAALDNKTVTVAGAAVGSNEDLTFEADFSAASFYPVFDYAEEKDDQYNITLYLYVHAGKFADKLSNDMIRFADDFKDAKVTELTRESDNTAKLILSLPSGGKSVENIELNGTVVIAADGLVSRWGDCISANSTYTRAYNQGSMGKDLSDVDIDVIKIIVGGFGNTTMGTIFSVGSGLASAGSGTITVLEMLGVIESEKAKLDKIYGAINDLSDSLSNMSLQISEGRGKDLEMIISDFYSDNFDQLVSYRKYALNLIANAQKSLKSEGVNAPAAPIEGKVSSEWDEYMKKVMKKVSEMDYQNYFAKLLECYLKVQAKAAPRSGVSNIIDHFDEYMTYYYNFDTLAYNDRENFRTLVNYELLEASVLICSYNKYAYDYPDEATIKDVSDKYDTAKKLIDSKKVVRRTDKKAYMYLTGDTIVEAHWAYSPNNVSGLGRVNMSDEQAKVFIGRQRGKPLIETIEQLGVDLRGSAYVNGNGKYDYSFDYEQIKQSFSWRVGFIYHTDFKQSGDGFFTRPVKTHIAKIIPIDYGVDNEFIRTMPHTAETYILSGGFWFEYQVKTTYGLVLITLE